MRAILAFEMKLLVEFTCQTVNFFNQIAKATWAKLNVFRFCEPHQGANNGNPFKVSVNASLSLSTSISFQFKIWQTLIFCKFIHFQGVFFPSKSCIFVFMIATIFPPDSHQQYPFMNKCNSTLPSLR